MTDDELRALVRRAIARNPARSARPTPPSMSSSLADACLAPAQVLRQHPSHGLFAVPAGEDTGGPCMIEPAVACNHCGYCKSYGH